MQRKETKEAEHKKQTNFEMTVKKTLRKLFSTHWPTILEIAFRNTWDLCQYLYLVIIAELKFPNETFLIISLNKSTYFSDKPLWRW